MGTATSKTRDHFIFGGSNAERNYYCKGNVALKILKDIPNQPESPSATEGTQFHDLIEVAGKRLCEFFNREKTLPSDPRDLLYISDVVSYSSEMVDHALTWFQRLFEDIKEFKPSMIHCERMVAFNTSHWVAEEITPELRVALEKYNLKLGMGGSLDFFFAFKREGKLWFYISDAKYGAGKMVEATTLQLLFYFCAAYRQFQHKFSGPKPEFIFGGGIANIFQPRLEDDFGEVWRSSTYSAEDIKSWAVRFEDSANISLGLLALKTDAIEKGFLVADPKSDGWCLFCDCKHQCPAFLNQVNENAMLDFDEIEIEADLSPQLAPKELAASLIPKLDSPEKIAKFLTFIPVLKNMITHVQNIAIEELMRGNEIPGWKVVEGRSQRRFKKDEIYEISQELQRMGIEDPWDRKLRGIGSIESELKRDLGVKNPKEAIAHLVEKTSPGRSLAPEDDVRQAVTYDNAASDEFDAIELD